MGRLSVFFRLAMSLLFVTGLHHLSYGQPVSDCLPCHTHYGQMMWPTNPHAHTQEHVAGELAANWAGQPPDSVIIGSQAENCIACHAPRAVTIGGGMTESQAMGYFFSTSGGVYTDSTRSLHTDTWPDVTCVSCHRMPTSHPGQMPTLALFNSTTAQYDSVRNVSEQCGQCHGGLRFADTDHQLFSAWQQSTHGHRGQTDVASELASDWAGRTPAEVISGPDPEDCIQCHAPTAVKLDGGITEVQVLNRFFTTVNGRFTANTTVADTAHWPDVACNSCHDPHQPDSIAIYNSALRRYDYLPSRDQQCGQCHGNLRFAGTDHLSYNIEQGTGGIGVPDLVTMPGTHCTDCHMHRGDTDGTHSKTYEGHRWSVFTPESDGSVSASCTVCHAGMSADSAQATVDAWRGEFEQLAASAGQRVAQADSALQGSTDSLRLRDLDEAQRNLQFAQSDESGGAHNHTYVMALFNDAIIKADGILGTDAAPRAVPERFALLQNYPNPFNPSTRIQFSLAAQVHVRLQVYNELGERVSTLLDGSRPAGTYTLMWDGKNAAAGIYFYRLEAGSFTETKKMLLIR
ncbi:MAG TPA: T9SS type A sorting domain-containing protein [bacterium]|jgi:hypothetical protein